MLFKKIRPILSLACLALVLGACGKSGPPPESHSTTGVISAVGEGGKVLTIKHQAFPGWMEGMEMPFELKDPALAKDLKAGDRVSFTVTAEANTWPITAISKLESAGSKP
jgi:Cu/Ag efflux protein CusF